MEGLAVLVSIAVLVAPTIAAARWIMRPIDQAAKNRQHPAQFSLADFLCLFFLLQLTTGLVHWALASDAPTGAVWMMDGYAWFALGSLWYVGVRRLSRAGIRNPWARCIFLTIAIPLTLAVIAALPVSLMMLFVAAMSWAIRERGPDLAATFIAAISAGAGAAVAYTLGLSTRWMLRRYGAPAEPPPTRPFKLAGIPFDSPEGNEEADQP